MEENYHTQESVTKAISKAKRIITSSLRDHRQTVQSYLDSIALQQPLPQIPDQYHYTKRQTKLSEYRQENTAHDIQPLQPIHKTPIHPVIFRVPVNCKSFSRSTCSEILESKQREKKRLEELTREQKHNYYQMAFGKWWLFLSKRQQEYRIVDQVVYKSMKTRLRSTYSVWRRTFHMRVRFRRLIAQRQERLLHPIFLLWYHQLLVARKCRIMVAKRQQKTCIKVFQSWLHRKRVGKERQRRHHKADNHYLRQCIRHWSKLTDRLVAYKEKVQRHVELFHDKLKRGAWMGWIEFSKECKKDLLARVYEARTLTAKAFPAFVEVIRRKIAKTRKILLARAYYSQALRHRIFCCWLQHLRFLSQLEAATHRYYSRHLQQRVFQVLRINSLHQYQYIAHMVDYRLARLLKAWKDITIFRRQTRTIGAVLHRHSSLLMRKLRWNKWREYYLFRQQFHISAKWRSIRIQRRCFCFWVRSVKSAQALESAFIVAGGIHEYKLKRAIFQAWMKALSLFQIEKATEECILLSQRKQIFKHAFDAWIQWRVVQKITSHQKHLAQGHFHLNLQNRMYRQWVSWLAQGKMELIVLYGRAEIYHDEKLQKQSFMKWTQMLQSKRRLRQISAAVKQVSTQHQIHSYLKRWVHFCFVKEKIAVQNLQATTFHEFHVLAETLRKLSVFTKYKRNLQQLSAQCLHLVLRRAAANAVKKWTLWSSQMKKIDKAGSRVYRRHIWKLFQSKWRHWRMRYHTRLESYDGAEAMAQARLSSFKKNALRGWKKYTAIRIQLMQDMCDFRIYRLKCSIVRILRSWSRFARNRQRNKRMSRGLRNRICHKKRLVLFRRWSHSFRHRRGFKLGFTRLEKFARLHMRLHGFLVWKSTLLESQRLARLQSMAIHFSRDRVLFFTFGRWKSNCKEICALRYREFQVWEVYILKQKRKRLQQWQHATRIQRSLQELSNILSTVSKELQLSRAIRKLHCCCISRIERSKSTEKAHSQLLRIAFRRWYARHFIMSRERIAVAHFLAVEKKQAVAAWKKFSLQRRQREVYVDVILQRKASALLARTWTVLYQNTDSARNRVRQLHKASTHFNSRACFHAIQDWKERTQYQKAVREMLCQANFYRHQVIKHKAFRLLKKIYHMKASQRQLGRCRAFGLVLRCWKFWQRLYHHRVALRCFIYVRSELVLRTTIATWKRLSEEYVASCQRMETSRKVSIQRKVFRCLRDRISRCKSFIQLKEHEYKYRLQTRVWTSWVHYLRVHRWSNSLKSNHNTQALASYFSQWNSWAKTMNNVRRFMATRDALCRKSALLVLFEYKEQRYLKREKAEMALRVYRLQTLLKALLGWRTRVQLLSSVEDYADRRLLQRKREFFLAWSAWAFAKSGSYLVRRKTSAAYAQCAELYHQMKQNRVLLLTVLKLWKKLTSHRKHRHLRVCQWGEQKDRVLRTNSVLERVIQTLTFHFDPVGVCFYHLDHFTRTRSQDRAAHSRAMLHWYIAVVRRTFSRWKQRAWVRLEYANL